MAGFPVAVAESGFPVKIEGFSDIIPSKLEPTTTLIGSNNTGDNLGVGISDFFNPDSLGVSKNLFDIQRSQDGFFMGANGIKSRDSLYDLGISDFIEVEELETYSFGDGTRSARFLALFDVNKAVVAGGSDASIATKVIPSGVKYIIVSYYISDKARFAVEKRVSLSNYPDRNRKKIADNYKILPAEIGGYFATKNLFNSKTVRKGYYLANISGNIITSAQYCYSDFIEVEPSRQYTGIDTKSTINMRFISYYDKDKVKIVAGDDSSKTLITTPSNCRYVIISIDIAILKSFQFEFGNTGSYYEHFGLMSTGIIGKKTDSVNLNWYGLKWTSQGDSITAMNFWQQMVSRILGMNLTNVGVSGTRVAGVTVNDMCNDARVNTIPLDTDLITFMGGTNDWAQSIALGVLNSVDVTTYMGALNVAFQKMITRCPNARIITMTLPYGYYAPFSGNTIPYESNYLGLTTLDYGRAMQDVSRKYGLRCIDVQGNMGVSILNYTSFYQDGLHPSRVGARRIADMVIESLYMFNPF